MPTSDPSPRAPGAKTLVDDEIKTLPIQPARALEPTARALPRAEVRGDEPTVELLLAPIDGQSDVASRYTSRAILGEGGMGQVQLWRDQRIGREVASKLIRRDVGGQSDLRARFEREARIQGQLEHPSIVPVYDLGLSAEGVYFTMKRVHGHTLEQIVDGLAKRDPAFTERYTLRKLLAAFNQCALAIAFAHSRGVVHRDLKPANVMLGDFGEVYVLDWGLAKLVAQPDTDAVPRGAVIEDSVARAHTAIGSVMGTPGYMAPEQARGETAAIDARTDVYALGTILFELLALTPLHPYEAVMATLASTLEGADARPSARAPDQVIPPEFDAICVRATALTPDDRYASVRELIADIERFLDGDRDTARRRELAATHTDNAAAAAAKLASEAGAPAARAEAMRELNRALALDPTHQPAIQLMVRLLLTPPAVTPPEAEQAMARSIDQERRAVARVGTLSFFVWFALTPLLALVGVMSWLTLGGAVVLTALSALLSWWLSMRRAAVTDAAASIVLLMSTAAITFGSFYLSAFIIVPAMVAQNTLVFAMHTADRRRRLAVIAVGTLSVCVPVGLELLGVISPSFVFQNGAMVLLPRMVALPEIPTLGLLMLGSIVGVIIPSLVVGRVQDEAHEARRRVFTHLWHLNQLVPNEARAGGA